MSAKNGKPCKKCGGNDWEKTGHCNICRREYAKRWSASNRDKKRAYQKKWLADNPDKARMYAANRRPQDQDKKRANYAKWRAANPERARELVINFHARKPLKARIYGSVRRTRQTKAGGSFTAAEFKQLCNQYGNRCLKCGEVKKLTADHVIPVALGGSSDISNIQPLCKSCNSSKRATVKDYRNLPLAERWRTRSIFEMIDVSI